MKNFDKHILKIINLIEYDMYVITPDKHIDCICKKFETQQGHKMCPYCFGIGYKIKIRKIKGVRQPDKMSTKGMQLNTEIGIYFFKSKYEIREGDILVWDNEIEEVTRTDRFCSDAQKPVYYRCETRPKKTNTELFLNRLYAVLGKRRQRR